MIRDQRGFTLIELLIGATLMIVVLGSTLTVLTTIERRSREVDARNEAADIARAQVDELARELRNLASPTYAQPKALDKASAFDIVFKSVDPNGPNAGANDTNVRRVRYCIDASNPNNARLIRQTQTWVSNVPPAVPSTAGCPDAAWGASRVLAKNVTNRVGGQSRPVFTYDSATPEAINRIGVHLWVDNDAARGPVATKLTSAVFLRNQNRVPVASFTAQRVVGRTFLLNGSSSSDPEGDQLDYQWYDGSTKIGEGVTFSYTVPGNLALPRTITLKVFDEASLESAPVSQEVS